MAEPRARDLPDFPEFRFVDQLLEAAEIARLEAIVDGRSSDLADRVLDATSASELLAAARSALGDQRMRPAAYKVFADILDKCSLRTLVLDVPSFLAAGIDPNWASFLDFYVTIKIRHYQEVLGNPTDADWERLTDLVSGVTRELLLSDSDRHVPERIVRSAIVAGQTRHVSQLDAGMAELVVLHAVTTLQTDCISAQSTSDALQTLSWTGDLQTFRNMCLGLQGAAVGMLESPQPGGSPEFPEAVSVLAERTARGCLRIGDMERFATAVRTAYEIEMAICDQRMDRGPVRLHELRQLRRMIPTHREPPGFTR